MSRDKQPQFLKAFFFFLVAAFVQQNLYAQKETSEWFLYPDKHYKFSSSGPNQQSPSPTVISGSLATICDSTGNLLFYTSSSFSSNTRIYDRNNNLLPFFTTGDVYLRADNANIYFVKNPGNDKQYYVFYSTLTDLGYGNASWKVQYAVIDISLNNGNGDIIASEVKIDSAVSYGFTISRKPGSNDFWVITHKPGTDQFNSWPVTSAGVGLNPVISNAGQSADKSVYDYDEFKTSPNGKMIAGLTHFLSNDGYINWDAWFIEVFNFDGNSGIVTNKVKSTTQRYVNRAPGHIEFSPDNRLLYANYLFYAYNLQPCGYGAGNLYQYNLCYTDSFSFSKYVSWIGQSFSFCDKDIWGQFQIAPDKKIYFPYRQTYTMSSIQYPNRIGSSSGYTFSTSYMQNGSGGYLPSFYHAYTERAVKNSIVYSGSCFPSPIQFEITNDTINNIQWNFGDAASGSNNTSALPKPSHVFSAPGIYTVTASLYNSHGTFIETVSEMVEMKDPNHRILSGFPTDTAICEGTTIPVKLSVINGLYFWTIRHPWGLYDEGVMDSLQLGAYGEEGTYIVEMHQNDCSGCIMIDSITVHYLKTPYVSLGSDQTLCEGDSTELYTNNPGSQTLWSTGAQTQTIWVNQAGKYWVRSEYDNNGCVVTDTINIKVNPSIHFSLPGDTTLCNNETLLLQPGVEQATYRWQDNSVGNSFTVTKPGKYWVTITNYSGCSASDTINVAYVNSDAVSLGVDTSLCNGDSLRLQLNISDASYKWNTGSTNDNITIKTSGEYWVEVNNNICTATDTINVLFKSPPVIDLGSDTILCDGKQLQVSAKTSNSTYLWQDGSVNDNLIITQTGQYWVKVNQQGCTSSDTINVSYKPLPDIHLGNDTVLCENTPVQLNAFDASIASYQWQDNSTSPVYNITKAGIYYVKVTGVNNCINADTIAITYNPLPVFTLGNDTILCEKQMLTLQVNLNNAQYQWQDGSDKNNYTISNPGLYWVNVSQNNCSKSDSIHVGYKPNPVVNLGNDTTLCEGTVMNLSAFNTGATYLWQDNSSSFQYTVTNPGKYSVIVSLDGCRVTDVIEITYNYKPAFSLGNDTTLCTGEQIILKVNANTATYAWQDGSSLPEFVVTQPGKYSVTVTNTCGSNYDEINISQGTCKLMMPSAFTPNGDGLNDVFRVKYPQFIKDFHMVIYNRLGEKVFETNNPTFGWDGSFKGIPQPRETYIWYITLSDYQGNHDMQKGTVTLIR